MVNVTTVLKIIFAILIIVIIILSIRYGYYNDGNNNVGKNGQDEEEDQVDDEVEEADEEERLYSKKGDSDYLSEATEQSSVFYSFEESGIKRSKPEQICKKILQRMFRRKFIRIKPKWLKNPETGYPLELDCYNEELGIALEYNGIQHYEWPNFTGQTEKQFQAQKRRDQFKIQRCREVGVRLLIIKYDVPMYKLEDEIFRQLDITQMDRRPTHIVRL